MRLRSCLSVRREYLFGHLSQRRKIAKSQTLHEPSIWPRPSSGVPVTFRSEAQAIARIVIFAQGNGQ